MSRVQKLEEAATVSAGQVVECDAAMLTKSTIVYSSLL